MRSKRWIPLVFTMAAVAALTLFSFAGSTNKTGTPTAITPESLEKMKACIEACNNCAFMCNNCASKCLKDKDVTKMTRCIQLCMECAAACSAASQLMSLESENAKDFCAQVVKLCDKCALECDKFTQDFCKECASACRKASKLCKEM
jgi:hypothetical protein